MTAGGTVTYISGADALTAEEANLVASADAALVFVGTSSEEGHDRESLALGQGQDDLVEQVKAT